MKTSWLSSFVLAAALMVQPAQAAPFMRPPAFLGGIPGKAQFQAIQMQRHQARTLLYREALEELRKNPQAADVPECPPLQTTTGNLCIRHPVATQTTDTAAAPAVSAAAPPVTSVTQDIKPPAAKLPAPAPAAALAPTVAPKPLPIVPTRHRIAILVGNNGYQDPIPALSTPVADVDQIAEVLRSRFGYETRVLHDASKAQIVQAINRVADEAKSEDSVLLFYAGHGYLMEDTKMGFWIPVDASVRTAANWISNTDIAKLLHAIPSRQVILVSDSCFSGSLTREQKLTSAITPKTEEILRQRSVLAFSSGDEEPVSDEGLEGHSIFAWHLIRTLASINGPKVGFEIYSTVRNGVTKDYQQVPQYGAVYSAGHMSGGEYLFDAK